MFARVLPLLLLIATVAVAGLFVLPRLRAPVLTERVTAEAIHAAVQREADTTFVVTGYLQLVATVRSRDTRVLLPEVLNLPLGTTRATVRVPGRVSYGFDIGALQPGMIRVAGDTVEVALPTVRIYSTEPDLRRLEVETSTGWLRRPVTAQEAERRAVRLLNEALRRQASAHLSSSVQPRVNTARALRRLLHPVLLGLGMPEPTLRVRLGEGLYLDE